MDLPAESVAERRIRQAIEDGEFDDLPGVGEPLPGAGRPDDELWWVRSWMQRNGIKATEITRFTGQPPISE